jgi:hypothetical protein
VAGEEMRWKTPLEDGGLPVRLINGTGEGMMHGDASQEAPPAPLYTQSQAGFFDGARDESMAPPTYERSPAVNEKTWTG